MSGLIPLAIASGIIGIVCYCGWLTPRLPALRSRLVWLKWYQTTPIRHVAMLETVSALLFLAIVAFALLPAHLIPNLG